MKIAQIFQILMVSLFLTVVAQAQNTKPNPNCDKPLSENSPTDIICSPNDRNLANQRTTASQAGTEGGSADQENPGACKDCPPNNMQSQARIKDHTAARPGSAEEGSGSNVKGRK